MEILWAPSELFELLPLSSGSATVCADGEWRQWDWVVVHPTASCKFCGAQADGLMAIYCQGTIVLKGNVCNDHLHLLYQPSQWHDLTRVLTSL